MSVPSSENTTGAVPSKIPPSPPSALGVGLDGRIKSRAESDHDRRQRLIREGMEEEAKLQKEMDEAEKRQEE